MEDILNESPEFDPFLSGDYCERITYAICTQLVVDSETVEDEYIGEEIGIEFWTFSHPLINQFCQLSVERCRVCGQSTAAWQQKLSDIAEYFLLGENDALCRMECTSKGGSAKIRARLSPHCYEPADFGNALVDMLVFLQRENERLEGLLKEAGTKKEAA